MPIEAHLMKDYGSACPDLLQGLESTNLAFIEQEVQMFVYGYAVLNWNLGVMIEQKVGFQLI